MLTKKNNKFHCNIFLRANNELTTYMVQFTRTQNSPAGLEFRYYLHFFYPFSHSLGVMLDDHFAMDAHISNICRSTYFHIRNIGAILLTPSAAAQLVHSLVTSRVDYCNALLLGVPDYKIKRLQRMHNIAASVPS